jgi:hypothetical protein
MWSVSVRHRGLRATFCVDNNNAVPYFRDREKTALTDGGRRRPIIHICDEHQREVAPGKFTTVKQHIRGLRTFDWRGYECAITAPTFHAFFINQFDVESQEFELDKLQPGFISASKYAGLLAQYEDTQSIAAADAQLKEKQE